jgi:hypothetical protein
MKNYIVSAAALALALMPTGPLATAQNGDWQAVESLPRRTLLCDDPSPADRIAAARGPYTRPEDVLPSINARVTLAQFPGRRPGPPFSRSRGYPSPAYPQMWSGRPSGRHALVGAIIGGLLGAAVGAKGNASAGSAVAWTALGAGLGAAIGLSVPSFPSFPGPQMYRRGWRDDREQASRPNSAFRPEVSITEAQSTGTPTEVQ